MSYEFKKVATEDYVDKSISSIGNGTQGVYDSLTALQTAFPNGTSGIYVTSDNGHWYYWNGSAWTDGGVYQSSEDVNQIKEDLGEVYPCVIEKVEHVSTNRFNPNTAEQKYFENGEFVDNLGWTLTDIILLILAEIFFLTRNFLQAIIFV